ncbi:MAG: hypothetical protein Q4B34_02390 [Candidatus Saccharibacteria bacterium]|nr:hypothetical protein [Candidatus Saccharibacteria bacterium]
MDNNPRPQEPLQGQGNFGEPMGQGPVPNAPGVPPMGPQGQMGPQMGPNMPPQGPMPGYGQPMMQPGYGQPMPMRPPKPPKQPMDPKKKKKIIIGVSVGVGVAIAAIVAVVLVLILTRVDYSESYKQAKAMDEAVSDLYLDSDCENVVYYANSTYTSVSNYDGYVSGCKSAGEGLSEKVAALGNTSGISRDEELKALYDKFKEKYAAAMPEDSATLAAKLDVYAAWHKYIYLVDDIYLGDPESEITAAANALINSGNETLKEYGEGWQEKTLALFRAYETYDNAPYSADNKSALREEYQTKRSEQSAYVSANKPTISEVVPLNFSSTSEMYEAWEKLFAGIAEKYQENYNSGSGDCTEFMGEVYCSH